MEWTIHDNCTYRNVFILSEEKRIVFRKSYEFINLPHSTCIKCEENLENLTRFLQEVHLNRIKSATSHGMKKMSDDGSNNQNEEHYDRYNCTCTKCREKYGSLPLLVDVIEQNEEELNRDQPSTSHNLPPSTSTTPTKTKKLMKCDHCEKIFTHKGDLNKHLRKHTGEQPFTCQICDRKFAHTSNLTRHMRLHSGSRPFKCDNCDKTFNRKDKLDLHRKGKSCRSPQ